MSEENKLKPGEKYLYIQQIGHEPITVFPNRKKAKANEPDFIRPGVGVWVNAKKESPKETKVKEGCFQSANKL